MDFIEVYNVFEIPTHSPIVHVVYLTISEILYQNIRQ